MTVADNTSRNQYTATSGQTVFAYTFEIVDKDHIVVLQNGTALSEGTDYTVSNVGNDSGGNITLTSGATAGDVMTLYRDMPYSRTQNYTNSGDFLASEVNSDFDELWLAGEQTDRSFSQSIRKPITDSDSISMELPEAADRANKFVKFDANGAVDVAGATVTVPADAVTISDAGNYYTSNDVEGALQEVGADLTANTTKLNTIETGADVTDTANVTAAGAVMDSELTNEAAVKALDQGVATTDSPTFAGLTTTADVSFGDNDKAIFGAGSDLQIYHNGTNSFIQDSGTGNLVIRSNNLTVQNAAGTEVSAQFVEDNFVKLFHDNQQRLVTTSTGIDVTGTVTANDLTLSDSTPLINLYDTDGSGRTAFQNAGGVTYLTNYGSASGTYGTFIMQSHDHTTAKEVIRADNTNIQFKTDGTEKMRITNSGIDVTGNVVSDGLTVDAVTYTGTDGTDGQVLMTDGAGNASFEDMPSSTYLDVKDFGATGDGTTDDTTAIQNAINHASTRGIQTIFFPEGHYKYTTLRFYHDQTDNTAFQGTNLFVGDSTDGTNGTTTFAFGWYIADASDLTVTVEGTEQTLNTHYTVSGVGSDTGGTITFTAGNVPQVPSTSTITRDGDGQELEFFYSGEVVPGATNLSVTVGGVTSTDYTVDIGKRLVVFNAGFAPPSGTGNVVITIKKTVKISSNNRDGRFQLRGTGRLAIADLVGLDKNRTRIYGSVLETTGDGIIIDTDQEFSTPVDARNFVAKDLTFIGDNTGYLLKAEKNPGMSLDTCSFKQFNPDGGGIQPRNCWFFTMNQCYVVGQRNIDTHYDVLADGSTLEQFDYTFDNPSATSDILVQFNGGALTETTDYTVTMGATKKVTLTQTGATKINTEYNLSGNRTINIQVINTGDGISSQFFGRSFGNFAGLWTITQSLVDSFANGIHWTNGTVTNFSIRDSGIQNCGNYNIYGDNGVIQQMLLDNVYMENQKTQGVGFIKGNGSGSSSAVIRNLKMTNCFFLGGGTNPRVTGPCIDLDSVDAINIEGMYHYRVRQPFLNITDTKNFQNVPGEIKNCIFASDSGQTKFLDLEPTVYLLKGILPNVHNCVWPGFTTDGFYNTTNNILLFDSTVESNFLRQYTDIKGDTGIAKFGFGDTKVVTGITSGPYNITGSDSRTYYDLTHSIAGGLKAILPDTGEFNDGRLIIIKNNEASTSSLHFPYINVVNNSDQSTVIAQLSPGQAGLFIMDKQEGNKFKYVGRAFTDNLDFADNHKISLGRGDSTGADLEIYHHSQSETFEDNAAGVTNFIYTFDSPAVSDHIKVERKPEGGSYSNTINFTVDLSTKTVVLGVATTLNEDIRISASESRIDSLDGVVIDGLVYPTADGSANQVLTTDGSGTLSFANVSGVGINAVVDDTTPQLGGDLDLNSHDITGTGNLDFTGSINTVLSVDGTTEDVFITGATPALEFIENDNGGSKMRMAWNSSGAFAPTLYQSLYGDSTTTYGGINIQTRASDASGNQVVYAYDPANDRNWWGTRAAGSVAMQLKSDGTFNVTGGDVVFEDSSQVDKFFWDASTSRLGLGETNPNHELHIKSASPQIRLEDSDGTNTYGDMQFNGTSLALITRGGASSHGVLRFQSTDGTANLTRMDINSLGDVRFYKDDETVGLLWDASESRLGIGTTSPGEELHINASLPTIRLQDSDGTNQYSNIIHSNGLLFFYARNGSSYGTFNFVGDDGTTQDTFSQITQNAIQNFYAGTWYIRNRVNGGSINLGVETSAGSLYYPIQMNGASDILVFNNATTELARFTTSKDFLVGKNTAAVGVAGLQISSTGSMTASIASGNAYHVYDTTNSAYRFYVSSAGQINATSTSITAISDQSLKENIRDLDKGLDTVLALQPRRFDWKNGDGNDIMGFVAQEVEEVMPELVHDYKYSETETKLGLKMGDMVPTLVKAIQDQQDIIENLKSRIEQLEGAN